MRAVPGGVEAPAANEGQVRTSASSAFADVTWPFTTRAFSGPVTST
jgi:hypothetical protein